MSKAHNFENFRDYLARSPRDVLTDLAHYYELSIAKGGTIYPPCVDVVLANGVMERGIIIKVDKRGDEAFLLLTGIDAHENPDNSLIIFNLDEISSVRIYNAPDYASVLSGGRIPDRSHEKAPSRLELIRYLKSINTDLFKNKEHIKIEIEWENIPKTNSAYKSLGKYLNAASEAVKESLKDKVGQQAWAGLKGLCIKHEEVDQIIVEKKDEQLIAKLNLTIAVPIDIEQRFSKKILEIL
jgi:hypothetical protein